MTAATVVLSLPATHAAPAVRAEIFTDRTRDVNLDFVHVNGMSGRFYILEIVGSGGALFDYDNDGDLDLYAVQGEALGPGKAAPAGARPSRGAPGDRLFRNDLRKRPDGSGVARFTDVTGASRIEDGGYGMGATTADFDNDGWIDLYVTNYGSNRLLKNNGDGTFSDVTARAGVDDPAWSTAAAFLDIDRDGWLDLYVANYLNFTYDNHVECRAASSRMDYCGPARYRGVPDRLFRNRGDGTFEDISARAGIGKAAGKGLGVVATDADGDGWVDIYVANDGEPNFLWLNRAGRRFDDEALLAGAAVDRNGRPESSMGVDAGDFDGDGDDDLFMTHLTNEKNTLYVNRTRTKELFFEDRSFETGLATPSLPFTGFGTLWSDYDNDGWLDLPVVNGAVFIIEKQAAAIAYPLRQTRQLFRNLGGGTFADVTARTGAGFQVEDVGRGLAAGDVDNDGDADLVVFNSNGPARLFVNNVGQDAGWIGFRLVGARERRDMLGARLAVTLADGRTLWRRVHTDGGYLSAHDPRVLVGLGAAAAIRTVSVRWPDGRTEEWSGLAAKQYHTLKAGSGRAR